MYKKLLENGSLLVQICVHYINQYLSTFIGVPLICHKLGYDAASSHLKIIGMALVYWNFCKSISFNSPFWVVVLDAACNGSWTNDWYGQVYGSLLDACPFHFRFVHNHWWSCRIKWGQFGFVAHFPCWFYHWNELVTRRKDTPLLFPSTDKTQIFPLDLYHHLFYHELRYYPFAWISRRLCLHFQSLRFSWDFHSPSCLNRKEIPILSLLRPRIFHENVRYGCRYDP